MARRDHWASSLTFVLAASGSAIGLGNLWKFPYITWENGGGSFVLIYLLCIAVVGIPVMAAEIIIGRSAQLSTVPAFETLGEGKGKPIWSLVGWAGVAAGAVILSYYAVIAGWSISSFTQCLGWSLDGYEAPAADAFRQFTANGGLQVGLAFIFSAITVGIVIGGISGGIEKATKFLMPALFVILLLLLVNAFSMDGVGQAFAFLFHIGPITSHGLLEAMGHSFFTLSVGIGGMITYGSYMRKEDSIVKATLSIALLDTLIAVVACIIMYTILFTYPEVQKEVGASAVGMLFITIPRLFYTQMSFGPVLAPIFFILVGFAALSSTISMLEVVVSCLIDRLGIGRKKATLGSACLVFVGTTGCALSNGSVAFLTNFNPFGGSESGLSGYLNRVVLHGRSGFMTILDHLVSNWALPFGGLMITLFVGWFMDHKLVRRELLGTDEGRPPIWFEGLRFVLRFVTPLLILWILYSVNQQH